MSYQNTPSGSQVWSAGLELMVDPGTVYQIPHLVYVVSPRASCKLAKCANNGDTSPAKGSGIKSTVFLWKGRAFKVL